MKKFMTSLCFLLLAGILSAQPGSIDLTFNPGDSGFGHGDGPNDFVCAMAEQADGKILIGGWFTTYNGVSRSLIARIHPDGALDHTFDPGTGFDPGGGMNYINSIEVLASGKILVGGRFTEFNGQVVEYLVQLNPDGSLDENFDTGTGPNNTVSVVRQQNDGRILIGGRFTSYNDVSVNYLARLHPDGSLDTSFQGPGYEWVNAINEILELSDEKILVGGDFAFAGGTNNHYLVRLLSNGSIDTTFNTNFTPVEVGIGFQFPFVSSVHITDDNKYLIAGSLFIPGEHYFKCVIRLHDDGTLDEDFEIPLMTSYSASLQPWVRLVVPMSQGRFFISGNFISFNGIQRKFTAVIFSDGTLDKSFDLSELGAFCKKIHQPGGKLLISGDHPLGTNAYLLRLNEDFTIDPSFNPVTGANSRVQALALDGSEKIYIGGNFDSYNGNRIRGIARLFPDGTLDLAFDPGSGMIAGSQVFSIAPLQDGRILAGGLIQEFDGLPVNHLICLNSDGSLDTAFVAGVSPLGAVYHVEVDDNSKILVAGSFPSFGGHPFRIVRLNSDGSLDETFYWGQGANSRIRSLAIQNDGNIIIGGAFRFYDGVESNRIARLNANGSLDMGFNSGEGFQGSAAVFTLGLQSDGKIIAGGIFSLFNNIAVNGIVRLNTNGSFDTTFSPGFGPQGPIDKLLIQPDDKIIIGGRFTMFDSIPANHLARLNADGSFDTTFQTGTGFNNFVEAMALQEDGNILVGGSFTGYNETGRNRIARIQGGEPEGVLVISRQNQWFAFPNPATGYFTIKSEKYAQVNYIRLYDLQGRTVFERQNLSGTQFTIQIGNIPPGVYIVEIQEVDAISRLKVIKH